MRAALVYKDTGEVHSLIIVGDDFFKPVQGLKVVRIENDLPVSEDWRYNFRLQEWQPPREDGTPVPPEKDPVEENREHGRSSRQDPG